MCEPGCFLCGLVIYFETYEHGDWGIENNTDKIIYCDEVHINVENGRLRFLGHVQSPYWKSMNFLSCPKYKNLKYGRWVHCPSIPTPEMFTVFEFTCTMEWLRLYWNHWNYSQ